MAFAENLTPFFNSAEFAVAATLSSGGAGVVIYDENGLVVDEFNLQTSGPSAVCPASQWPGAAIGDTLTIGATTYLVRSARRIDDGALLLLTLARSN
jgi:hypothetical protein